MTRDELLQANMKIVGEVTKSVVKYSPNCIIIMVTNPLDAMTYLALKVSGFPANRVIGLSGALDATRLRYFIAAELGVSVTDVYACVVGEHGKNMVVIPRLCTVDGVPITTLLPQETIDRLIERTIGAGAEIVGLLKTGSAFYAPSAGVAHMVDAIIMDKKQVVQCAVCLQGEYGIKDTVISVPVKLDSNGVAEVVELELTPEEKEALASSAEAVEGLIKAMNL
jgi:malate dehydrogenase